MNGPLTKSLKTGEWNFLRIIPYCVTLTSFSREPRNPAAFFRSASKAMRGKKIPSYSSRLDFCTPSLVGSIGISSFMIVWMKGRRWHCQQTQLFISSPITVMQSDSLHPRFKRSLSEPILLSSSIIILLDPLSLSLLEAVVMVTRMHCIIRFLWVSRSEHHQFVASVLIVFTWACITASCCFHLSRYP